MSRIQYINDILKQVGQRYGLDDWALDNNGELNLNRDGLSLTLAHRDELIEALWLYIDLGEVDCDRATLLGLMQVGFATWAFGRFQIGLFGDDEHGRRAIGSYMMPVSYLSVDMLYEQLEISLESAGQTQECIQNKNFGPQR